MSKLQVRDITIDTDRIRVRKGDCIVPLTPTEYRLLTCMAERKGTVVSQRQLYQTCMHGDHEDLMRQSDDVKVYIKRLRRKLGHDLIINVRGFGYVIDEDEE